MGNISAIQKINFEDMQYAIQNNICIINTLSASSQKCLIKNTVSCDQEESVVNKYLVQRLKKQKIIIYGRNNNDITIFKKYEQLNKLGFSNLYIYVGGLFEWLCLQDIYGKDDFPTTYDELDILKYKPCKINI